MKEWSQLSKSNNKYDLHPVKETDLTHWEATIPGPTDSPYHDHNFCLQIDIPDNYPISPPAATFKSFTLPHANVKWETGEICLDTLKDHWSPIFNLTYIVESIVRLLSEPNGESPLNIELGILLREGDICGYNNLVQYWLDYK